jgi:toxin ParE1/3/4
MKQFRVSEMAQTDLDEIWFYIAQDNFEAADRLIAGVVSRFPKLASMPELGVRRNELAGNLRSFAVGNYVIFYRSVETGVEIARVLHGARNFPPLFE